MRFKLTAAKDEEIGEMGWRDSRVPHNSSTYGPLSYGYGLAHDMLEHFAFEHIGDEIQAHAAMYRLRYESGWYHPDSGRNLRLEDIASEWVNLIRGLENDGQLLLPPKTRPLSDEIESDISFIIEKGRNWVVEEFTDSEFVQDNLEILAERFRAYFRIGYRRCEKRYKGHDAYNVAQAYNMLAQALKPYRAEYEGQALSVLVDINANRVCVEEIYESV